MSLKNYVLFIGQRILGATAGAPLSASSTGLLASGISTSTVNATANTTTTNATATGVLIASMTLTPVSGTYFVSFNTSLQSNANNIDVVISIFSGGTIVTGTEMFATPQIQGGLTPSLNMKVPASVSCFVTVNGSQAIEARWRLSAAGTGTADTRILNIVRVA